MKDLEAALRVAQEAGEAKELETFRGELLPRLRELVPSDSFGYNEIDVERGTAVAISDAPLSDRIEQRFLALLHEHPLVPYHRRGDLSARLLSDFLSARELHRLALYHDVYRQLGIEDQIVFGLPGEGMVAIVLARRRRTFSERDRELLEVVRPHLSAAYARIRERECASAVVEALDRGLCARDAGVIQLDEQCRVEHVTSTARELLCTYLGNGSRSDLAVPERIRAWLEGGRPDGTRGSLVIEGPRGRLCVRILHGDAHGAARTLILEEHRARAPQLEALRSLGLTGRQAQVLRLLACGKQSRQIAAELQISVATVSKHLEHIYARLGVQSRAQAIARALR
jgi:DNA-binding CsgD family transcriptional regulator